VTAGDLIRQALADGSSELGLAKRLAGSTSDADDEVKRWRYVVRRARAGAEPQEENVRRIAAVFSVDPAQLERPARPLRRKLEDRLRALQAEVDGLTLAQREAQRAHDLLLERVEDLERRIVAGGGSAQEHTAELATRRAPTRRGTAR
jgi:chemotaxis regulatin CheY-phosphate phosphatase CheZ